MKLLIHLINATKGQGVILNSEYSDEYTKKEILPPESKLGIAILETIDKTGLTYLGLTKAIKDESKLQIKQTTLQEKPPIVDITPSTMHSYTSSGSKRTTRKYDPDYILDLLTIVQEKLGAFNNKWVSKEEIQAQTLSWLNNPLINHKRHKVSASTVLQNITGHNRQNISDWKCGRYKRETAKWEHVVTTVDRWLVAEHNKFN